MNTIDNLAGHLPELFKRPPNLPESLDEEFSEGHVFVPVDKPEPELPEHYDFPIDELDPLFGPMTVDQFPDPDSPEGLEPPPSSPSSDIFGDGRFPGTPQAIPGGPVLPPADCLAFYLPFHYFYPRWWGIYLVAEGVDYLARVILFHTKGRVPYHVCWLAARVFLYGHEYYHHRIESLATRLEIAHREPAYATGFEHWYRSVLGTDDCLEEGLANAYALKRIKKVFRSTYGYQDIADALDQYVLTSPPGYRMGVNFLGFEKGHEGELTEYSIQASYPSLPQQSPEVWESAGSISRGIGNVRSRIHYIIPRSSPLSARVPNRF